MPKPYEVDEVYTPPPGVARARRLAAFAAFRASSVRRLVKIGGLSADRGGGRDVGAVGGRPFGEIVRQLGVPGSGLFGNRALGFHPFLDGSSGVIARVRLHDPGPQLQRPGPPKPHSMGLLPKAPCSSKGLSLVTIHSS